MSNHSLNVPCIKPIPGMVRGYATMPPMNPERSIAQGHRDSVRYRAGKESDAGCRDVMMNSREALGDVRPTMMHSHRPGGAWKGHAAMDLNEG